LAIGSGHYLKISSKRCPLSAYYHDTRSLLLDGYHHNLTQK
jgi:hypothetical protein